MKPAILSIDAVTDALFERPLRQQEIRAAILRFGIWIDPRIYRYRPHLVPFAVRDARSRSNAHAEGLETWGSPNPNGYFRDDNTLIKNWVKSLIVASPNRAYDGRRVKSGFVACHVWRGTIDGKALHSDPLLNSFVPNLVWLPRSLAYLSDQVGSYTQRLLQVIARNLYGNVEFTGRLGRYVRKSWRALPPPSEAPNRSDSSLSLFAYDAVALQRHHDSLARVVAGIKHVRAGNHSLKVYSTRYGPGLRLLPAETLDTLIAFLETYLVAPPE